MFNPWDDIKNAWDCVSGNGGCGSVALDLALRKAEKLADMAKALKKLFKNNPCNCLVAQTQVLTQEGYKDIQDIEVGDIVWAKDSITGLSEWKSVTSIFTNIPKPTYVITLQVENGEVQTIESTDDHPFYVVDLGWVKTINLHQGYQIETKDGENLTVISVELTGQAKVTYNFSVDDFHTYYITEYGVLVHNAKGPCSSIIRGLDSKEFDKLTSKWDKGSYKNELESIFDHADRKGYGDDIAKYLRKAANFNKKGAKKSKLRDDGTILYTRKNGEYLIERDGKIVSYGFNDV